MSRGAQSALRSHLQKPPFGIRGRVDFRGCRWMCRIGDYGEGNDSCIRDKCMFFVLLAVLLFGRIRGHCVISRLAVKVAFVVRSKR